MVIEQLWVRGLLVPVAGHWAASAPVPMTDELLLQLARWCATGAIMKIDGTMVRET